MSVDSSSANIAQCITSEAKVEENANEEQHKSEDIEAQEETAENINSVNEVPQSNIEEEHDVPENFFDELMNEDFIEGLNVVDTWDESELKKQEDLRVKIKEKCDVKTTSRKRNRSPHQERRHNSRDCSPQKPSLSGRSSENRRSRSREKRDRRDPNKTQRDIQRDKDKCAKDQKAKLICEKLKVVETGLVPPGMEMEVDLQAVGVEKLLEPVGKNEKKERIPKRTERRKSPGRHITQSSGINRSQRSPNFDRVRNDGPKRGSWRRSPPSALKFNRSRSRSPGRSYKDELRILERKLAERKKYERELLARSRSKSPRQQTSEGLRRRNSSQSPRRWRNSKSPRRGENINTRRQQNLESPFSDVSDRERWLRRRSNSRHRNKSPIRRKTKSFLEELDDKLSKNSGNKSFLLELKEQLNQQSQQQCLPMMHNYAPTPVPPPQHYPSQNMLIPQAQEYDQQFFIGNSQMPLQPNNFLVPANQQLSYIPQEMPMQMMPQPHMPFMMASVNVQPLPTPEFFTDDIRHNQQAEKDTAADLFKDKKITLTEYLSLNSKLADTRPVSVKTKMRVIKDCKDAVKILSGEWKQPGKFVPVKKKNEQEKPSDKNQSPFKRIPVAKFQYTTLTKQPEENPAVASSLNMLLYRLGKNALFEETDTVDSLTQVDSVFGNDKYSKLCQTERVECEECKIRKSKVYEDKQTQTSDILSFDVFCQVSADDIQRAQNKGFSKNQSLASMTPAQLLAQSQRSPSPPETFPKYSSISSSPDSHRARLAHGADVFTIDLTRDMNAERYAPRHNSGMANADNFDIGTFDNFNDSSNRNSMFNRSNSGLRSVQGTISEGRFASFNNSDRSDQGYSNMGHSAMDSSYGGRHDSPFNNGRPRTEPSQYNHPRQMDSSFGHPGRQGMDSQFNVGRPGLDQEFNSSGRQGMGSNFNAFGRQDMEPFSNQGRPQALADKKFRGPAGRKSFKRGGRRY